MKQRKQRSRQRFLALVMLVVFTVSIGTLGVTQALAADPQDPQAGLIGINEILNMGDPSQKGKGGGASDNNGDAADYAKTVYFGKQGGAVLWRVLSTGDKVMLLSDKLLAKSVFNENSDLGSNVWNGSKIRGLLKANYEGTDTTIITFDGREKALIAETTLSDVDQGDTKDHLFLLSYDEVKNADYGFNSKTSRKAGYTSGSTTTWWLRTPYDDEFGNSVRTVPEDGEVDSTSSAEVTNELGVRVAFNLDPASVLFLSAATNGKGAVNVGDGFALVTTYTGSDGWKLTLKDTSITAPTGVTVSQTKTGVLKTVDEVASETSEGGTMDLSGWSVTFTEAPKVSYTSADIDSSDPNKANYVSAVVTDKDGNYVNYAKISNATTLDTATSVATTGLADNKAYNMYVFAERANGNKETDYASALGKAYIIGKGNATVDWGTLSKIYATKELTAKLSNGFNLSFDATETAYKTSVTLDASATGTITADTAGTTLAGDVTINNGAILDMANKFTLAGTLYGKNSTLNCDNLAFATSGMINLNDNATAQSERTFRNFTVNNSASGGKFNANNATFVINTDLAGDTGDTIAFGDKVTVSGTAKVQVAYDPFYDRAKDKEEQNGTHKFLTVTNGEITIKPKETLYTKGDGIKYSFTPIVLNKDDGTDASTEWKITGLSAEEKKGATETTKAVSDTAQTIGLAWIDSINNLQKRLGDLRGGEESNMGWVRFARNLDDLNNGRKLNVSGNLYQIGYDFALKNDKQSRGYFGLSLERFDGTQSFNIGGGDVKSTTLGAYYTKIYESGHYFDFIFRYGRYESDTTSYDSSLTTPELTKLDYALNGITLSGEYGYRANIGKSGLYLEPQAEFIYGYLGGASKTSSTGILADIDSTNHFVTRIGLALGQRVKNFNYYLRGSYYHDFAGSTNITYGDASYKQDSAQNWWEVSLGGGWNLSDTSYFYAEFTKHFKDVSNSLNFNLGFRFTL